MAKSKSSSWNNRNIQKTYMYYTFRKRSFDYIFIQVYTQWCCGMFHRYYVFLCTQYYEIPTINATKCYKRLNKMLTCQRLSLATKSEQRYQSLNINISDWNQSFLKQIHKTKQCKLNKNVVWFPGEKATGFIRNSLFFSI